MGDPSKIRKKYQTPNHPWNKERIEQESVLVIKYGLKNKKEIWRASSLLRNFTNQAKTLVVSVGNQAEVEKENLLNRVKSLGLGGENPTLDTILSLKTEDILERRLQTVLYKKQLARSVKQARQFIVHQHVMVNGEKMTVPSYLVKMGDVIEFSQNSGLNDPEHPERYNDKVLTKEEEELAAIKAKAKKKPVDPDLDVDDSLLEVEDSDVEVKIDEDVEIDESAEEENNVDKSVETETKKTSEVKENE